MTGPGQQPGESELRPSAGDVMPAVPTGATPHDEVPVQPKSRSGRLIGALRVSYVYQAVVLIAGLWLTPFLITHLGESDYGLWIAGTQIVAWLSIMDLGVVALVPREAAIATGVAASTGDWSAVPRLIDRTVMLVLWQLPVVAMVTLVVWMLLPREYDRLAGPLLVVFAMFIVGFPFRVFQAVLTGLQDLVFVSVQTSIAWTLGFVLTVGLVKLGFGLYALAAGFVAVQLYQFIASWVRLRVRHRHALPARLTPLPWAEARRLLMSGTWFSVAQVAQVLVFGTDVVIITNLLGAEAVVPYAITAKLVVVLGNQPSTVIQTAFPAMSEIRGTDDMGLLKRAASALTLAMLIASGVVFCVVLVVNEAFVDWWGVPNNPYAGDLLTGVLLFAMIARHANYAIVLTLFSLGGEKHIALTTLVDGLVSVIAAVILVKEIGIIGAPIGSLIGVLLISVPTNLRKLSTRARIPVAEWVRPMWGWSWRFILLVAGAGVLARQSIPPTFLALAATTILVTGIFIAMMIPVTLRPPLAAYVVPRLGRFGSRWQIQR
jgi:O-antigen/teichoic acid export membrane protein